jgi:hypothetical protein
VFVDISDGHIFESTMKISSYLTPSQWGLFAFEWGNTMGKHDEYISKDPSFAFIFLRCDVFNLCNPVLQHYHLAAMGHQLTTGRSVEISCESSSKFLKQFKVGSCYIMCSIEIVKDWRCYVQVLKLWDLVPLEDITKLAKRVDNEFRRYIDEYIVYCKENGFDGMVEFPLSWPISTTEGDQVASEGENNATVKRCPNSIGNLTGLEYIDMSFCRRRSDLPSNFLLPKLASLRIDGCSPPEPPDVGSRCVKTNYACFVAKESEKDLVETMAKYKGAYLGEQSPHPFAIAAYAYRKMLNEEESQAILVSGEGGAGKTESTKMLMHYLAYLGGRFANAVKHDNKHRCCFL